MHRSKSTPMWPCTPPSRRPDFLREQKQQLATIEREKTEPFPLALRVLPGLIYGKGHPTRNPGPARAPPPVSPDSRAKIWPRFHAAWFKPNHATLIVVGDTTLEEMKPKLEKLFSAWTPRRDAQEERRHGGSAGAVRGVPDGSPGRAAVANSGGQRGAAQEHSRRGVHREHERHSGRRFRRRLNMNLREDKHWAYGAATLLMSARGQRPFLAMLPSRPIRPRSR